MATPTALPAAFTVGQVLTSTQVNNLRGAFRILQVVSASGTGLATSTSATYADSGLTISITPSSTSSKIFIVANHSCYNDANATGAGIRLVRGSTTLTTTLNCSYAVSSTSGSTWSMTYLDSPATTSATTYKTTFARTAGLGTVALQPSGDTCSITVFEISA